MLRKRTHLWTGIVTGTILILSGANAFNAFFGSVIGQLIADADTVYGHRKYTHNIWLPIILFLMNQPLTSFIAFSWLIHIAIDCLTIGQTEFLWPFVEIDWQGWFKNGSIFETIYNIIITMVLSIIIFLKITGGWV